LHVRGGEGGGEERVGENPASFEQVCGRWVAIVVLKM